MDFFFSIYSLTSTSTSQIHIGSVPLYGSLTRRARIGLTTHSPCESEHIGRWNISYIRDIKSFCSSRLMLTYYYSRYYCCFCFHRLFLSSLMCEYVRRVSPSSSSSSPPFGLLNEMLLLQHRDTSNEIKRPRRRDNKKVNRDAKVARMWTRKNEWRVFISLHKNRTHERCRRSVYVTSYVFKINFLPAARKKKTEQIYFFLVIGQKYLLFCATPTSGEQTFRSNMWTMT